MAAEVHQCNACGAVFRTVQKDGTAYYHACPPDRVTQGAVVDQTGKVTTPEIRTPIATPRDENVTIDAETKTAVATRVGLGTTKITDPAALKAFGL